MVFYPNNELTLKETNGLSALSYEAQSLFINMTYDFIAKGHSVFFLNRTPFAEELVKQGFCFEHTKDYTAFADYHPKDTIINVLKHARIYKVFPAQNTDKKELHDIIRELEENRIEELREEIILLDLLGNAEDLKHSINGNVYMEFHSIAKSEKQKRLNMLLDKGILTKPLYERQLSTLGLDIN